MQLLTDIGIRSAWREHVAAAINWRELKDSQTFDGIDFISLCLDLFFGGSLLHETDRHSLQCQSCSFVQNNEPCPACEIHLGVIEAFVQALIDESWTARRVIKDHICKIKIGK